MRVQENMEENNYKKLTHCPYCRGKLVKRGKRKKKFEVVQRYYCQNCKKSLISPITKNKTYPLRIILDSLSLYNKLCTLQEIIKIIQEKYGVKLQSKTISLWLEQYKSYLPFLRMREFVKDKYNKKEIIEESNLFHKQIYQFKYHKAKIDLILQEEFRHYRFKPLKDFLELVVAECPHQIFQEVSKRASEFKGKFNLEQVKITPKNNFAVKITNFVIQTVSNNKLRHEILQNFMLLNDTVTIAVEVPILMNAEDLKHYQHELNFDVPIYLEDNEHITGHIDLIQIRNGSIYVLDFKPSAKKEKPIEQLTLYALALSRLTGIRLYHFKCAWFDSKDYFEFFPLHVVYKLKNRPKKKFVNSGKINPIIK